MRNEMSQYLKNKERLLSEIKKKRMLESKNMEGTRNFRKKFETQVSRRVLLEDKEQRLLTQKQKEYIRQKYKKRLLYAQQAQTLHKATISKEKVKERLSLIEELHRSPKENIPRVKRKTGKYYNVKLKKPNHPYMAKVQSLGDDHFYSDISTKHEKVEPESLTQGEKTNPTVVINKN